MPSFTVGDESQYYQEHGAGGPLVLAHGLTMVGEGWADVLTALAERYRVLVPDLRVMGAARALPIGFSGP